MPKTEKKNNHPFRDIGILFLLQECVIDQGMNRILEEELSAYTSMHEHENKLCRVSRKNTVDNQEYCSWDGASKVKLSKTLCQAQKVAAQLIHKQTMHPPTGGWPQGCSS